MIVNLLLGYIKNRKFTVVKWDIPDEVLQKVIEFKKDWD